MMNFYRPSNTGIVPVTIILSALLISSLMISSDAAYGRYYIDTRHYRTPTSSSSLFSMPLGSRLLSPNLGTSFDLVSRRDSQRRAMMDELLDTMLGGAGRRQSSSGPHLGLDELLFYDPFPFQRGLMDRGWPLSSYFLRELPTNAFNTLVPSGTSTTQDDDDDTQLRIVMHLLPGTTARDIHLNLEEDTTNQVLSISGKTKREENGISVHSRFERSYSIHPRDNVDTSKITAQLDADGVLTIVAPKHHPKKEEVEGKDNVRMIDIVEQQAPQQNVVAGEDDTVIEKSVVDVQHQEQRQEQEENSVTAEMNVDDSVIDLDVK